MYLLLYQPYASTLILGADLGQTDFPSHIGFSGSENRITHVLAYQGLYVELLMKCQTSQNALTALTNISRKKVKASDLFGIKNH